jgi:HAD superfamily hydrolase (TIGR01509 family)
MQQPIRAVVFDLDGLMFDTEALFFRVSSEMLEARGKAFTPEIMRAMIGRRAVDAGHVLKTMTGLDDPIEVLLDDVRQRFYSQMETVVHPTPGLFVLLDHLRRKVVPIAVATSSGRAYAERLLVQHRLQDRFAFILTAEDVRLGKPDPEIYSLAIERFAVAPGSVMALEDSPAGIIAAKSAGALAVGVPHEHSPAEALQGADLIVPRLDAPALLARLEIHERKQ